MRERDKGKGKETSVSCHQEGLEKLQMRGKRSEKIIKENPKPKGLERNRENAT